MATATVTNVSGHEINALAEYDTNVDPLLGVAGLVAQSSGLYGDDKGHRTDPLPYPFDRVGALANAATATLPVHPEDFDKVHVWETHTPSSEWNQLVQNGTLPISFATESGVQDVFEDLISTV